MFGVAISNVSDEIRRMGELLFFCQMHWGILWSHGLFRADKCFIPTVWRILWGAVLRGNGERAGKPIGSIRRRNYCNNGKFPRNDKSNLRVLRITRNHWIVHWEVSGRCRIHGEPERSRKILPRRSSGRHVFRNDNRVVSENTRQLQ